MTISLVYDWIRKRIPLLIKVKNRENRINSFVIPDNQMKKLRHMQIFTQIAESGSITRAAESLQLSKSVVSQHLKTLELELGVLLIKRSTRKHSLTSAGIDFYESCKEINKMTNMAWQRAQESIEIPKGYIKITAPNAFMDVVIAPAIGRVLKSYPLLEPELVSSDKQLDLMKDNIDLAIRVGNSQVSNIKQRRIGEFRDILCGSTDLVKNNNADTALYIANKWQDKDISHHFRDTEGNELLYQAKAQCRSNSFYSCLELIKEGAGIGLVPDFQFNKTSPALCEVFPQFKLPKNPVYALYPYGNHLPSSLKVCITAIENHLNILTNKHSNE
jgi:DNA-binding transcriptional LysR family regulator